MFVGHKTVIITVPGAASRQPETKEVFALENLFEFYIDGLSGADFFRL